MNRSHASSFRNTHRRWVSALLALMLLTLTLPTAPVAHAATITVNTTTDEFGTGASCSLREAIRAANTNAAFSGCSAGAAGMDTIELPAGTYTLSLTGQNEDATATGDLDILESITINGAGQSTTIIGGNNTDAIFDTFAAPSALTLNLNNLTLQNGNPTGAGFQGGGALYVKSTVTAVLTRVSLLNNTAATNGGAIWNDGDLTITIGTLSGNQATDLGGAIYAQGTAAKFTILNSTVSNNTAELGGALYISMDPGNNATIENSTLSGNSAVDRPGGSATDFGDGGAIYATTDGSVILQTSTVSGNTGARHGGGIYFDDSSISATVGTLNVQNSTIANNTANSAATATGDGGGIFVTDGTATLRNTIVGDNTDIGGANTHPDLSGTFTDGGNNLIERNNGSNFASGTRIGTIDSPVDPQLSALADNGGPTFTHALASTSPAVDAIATGTRMAHASAAQPATCTANSSYDQRGVFRANGGSTGSACDIGAFEFGQTATAVTIASFSSQSAWGSGPQLLWETANESGLSGFHIWRGTAGTAETRLTETLIGATGSFGGSEYTWQDSARIGWGQRTHYWLEAVNADGSSTFTGPVEVLGIGRLYLPGVRR